MLVPVVDAEKGKTDEKVDLPISGAPEGTTGKAEKDFDREISMDRQPNLTDEMRQLSGEDKKPKWEPWYKGQPEYEEKDEMPESKPEPAEKAGEQSKDEKPETARPKIEESAEIEVGGKKMKVVDLAKSYEELQRKFGQQGQEFGSERIKYRAEIEKLEGERKFLETMAAGNFVNATRDGKPSSGSSAPDEINQEAIDKMLEEGKSVEAINKIVEARMGTIQRQIEERHQAALKEKEVGDRKRDRENAEMLARQNLSSVEADPDFQSFKENRAKFGAWMEEIYGNDPAGLAKITEACMDLGKLKRSYRTYLKDTVDFTAAIEKAKAEGQGVAAMKERLAPVGDRSSVVPDESKGKPRLRPSQEDDGDMVAMESILTRGMGRRGFFGKDGFLR